VFRLFPCLAALHHCTLKSLKTFSLDYTMQGAHFCLGYTANLAFAVYFIAL
jgi:hypothetical protein